MKQAFHAFVRVRSSATLNLSWAGPGDLVIKRYFESGSESRQALVLDPSGSLNQALAKAPNLEQHIALVMRRIQATPVLWSCDIAESFFRIKTAPESPTGLFLMDFDKEKEELGPGPNSTLVIVRTLVTMMGFFNHQVIWAFVERI